MTERGADIPRKRADTGLWQVGFLALLLVLVVLPGEWCTLALAAWGGAALGSWIATVSMRDVIRRLVLWAMIAAYIAPVALLTAGPAYVGAALAPLAVLGLVALLPRSDTGPAAGDWANGVVAVAWAVLGVAALFGLRTIPETLGSAAMPVVGALLAYATGRRAASMQGFSNRVALGVGMTLAVAGSIAFSDTKQAVATVLGVALGITLSQFAPAPPRSSRPGMTALMEAQQQVVFAAPITFGILWAAGTLL
ncbi:MAG: hypothetical protein ACR2M0_05195 [Chloroflexia bacterium]